MILNEMSELTVNVDCENDLYLRVGTILNAMLLQMMIGMHVCKVRGINWSVRGCSQCM